METLSVTSARSNLYSLIDEAGEFHRPIQIIGKRHNAVLISEADWRAIQETLFLCSIPKMRETICQGMAIPIKKCRKKLDW